MKITRWLTIAVFGVLVMQVIILWIQAKKTGKNVWLTIRSSAFMVAIITIMLVRESVGEIPARIDLALLIPPVILLALAFWSGFVQAKEHLQNIGLLAKKKE